MFRKQANRSGHLFRAFSTLYYWAPRCRISLLLIALLLSLTTTDAAYSLLKQAATSTSVLPLPTPVHQVALPHFDHSEFNEDVPGTSLCDRHGVGGITALGMESEQLPDSALSASSAFDPVHVAPANARLRKEKHGGAWCPQGQVGPNSSEWIQVDLGRPHVVTGVATQGRYGKGLGQEFTEWYYIFYSRQKEPSEWIKWKSFNGYSILEGNNDPNKVSEQHLQPPVVAARHIRLVPLSNHTRTVCLRFELYGCSSQGLISYSLPAPVEPVERSELLDITYDGSIEKSGYSKGLGQLTDGIKTSSGTTDSLGQDFLWLAWPQRQSPLRFLFEFDKVHNFSLVTVTCRNQPKRGIGTFSSATVWFSLDSHRWSQSAVRLEYEPDNVIELPRDIAIPLHGRLGQYVRLELTFRSRWLHLSEVDFDGTPLPGNLSPAQVAQLFNESHWSAAYHDVSTGDGTRYTMPEDNALSNNHSVGGYPGGSSAYDQTIKYSLIIATLCALGLIILSLLTSLAMKKMHQRKSNVFREMCDSDLASENATISMKNIPQDPSPLYCDPKEVEEEAEYAVPDVICPSNLSKTLHLHKSAPSAITCKTLQINPRFYASSDIVHPTQQNIYGTRLVPQIRNVFDMGNFRATSQPQPPPPSSFQKKLSQQQTPLLDTFGSGRASSVALYCNTAARNTPSGLYEPLHGTFGVRLYSEAEVGVLQSLGKSKYGDVLLCNLPTISGNAAKSRLVVVRTVNDLTLKAEFSQSIEYQRQLASHDKFARLLGVIDVTPTYFASITEHADCDLNYFLRKSSPDSLSYDSLLYIASQIAAAGAYLEQSKQTHQDIATRNVIVYEKSLAVKLTDVARHLDKYARDYYNELPIRWMSPEAIVRAEFSIQSDVYAFGVSFWEILTMTKCRPFAELSDEDLLAAVYSHFNQEEPMVRLPRPAHCTNEIYELLEECCDPSEAHRPTFQEISLFLQRKTLAFQKTTSKTLSH